MFEKKEEGHSKVFSFSLLSRFSLFVPLLTERSFLRYSLLMVDSANDAQSFLENESLYLTGTTYDLLRVLSLAMSSSLATELYQKRLLC